MEEKNVMMRTDGAGFEVEKRLVELLNIPLELGEEEKEVLV